MIFKSTKILTGFFLCFFCATGTVQALPLGEREASHFTREALRILREVITNEAEPGGGDMQITLDGKTIREVAIQSAKVTFKGFSPGEFSSMQTAGIDIARLQEAGSLEV